MKTADTRLLRECSYKSVLSEGDASELFLPFSVSNLLFMLLCGYCFQKDVPKQTYMRSGARGGELSPSACPGVGNRPLRTEKKIANPWGYARRGHGYQDEHPAKTDT